MIKEGLLAETLSRIFVLPTEPADGFMTLDVVLSHKNRRYTLWCAFHCHDHGALSLV